MDDIKKRLGKLLLCGVVGGLWVAPLAVGSLSAWAVMAAAVPFALGLGMHIWGEE